MTEKRGDHGPADYPALPIDREHWLAVIHAMKLSPRQAGVIECMLRGMGDKQIAARIGIRPPTVRTYFHRICVRHGVEGRMGLARTILGISYELLTKTRSGKPVSSDSMTA